MCWARGLPSSGKLAESRDIATVGARGQSMSGKKDGVFVCEDLRQHGVGVVDT